MSNTFVKYCPLCDAENSRLDPFCTSCGDADLSTVPVEPSRHVITETTIEKNATDQSSPPPISLNGTRRVDFPKNTACNDTCVLELIDNPSISFVITAGQTVGRTEKADIILKGVPQFEWISGAHARFFKRTEQWFVQHVAETNFIKVQGETYEGQEQVAIYNNYILVLSLTSFRIKLPGE